MRLDKGFIAGPVYRTCRIGKSASVSLPSWFPREPNPSECIIDVRRVRRIDIPSEGNIRIRFSSRPYGRYALPCSQTLSEFFQHPEMLQIMETRARAVKALIFQISVTNDVISAIRFREVTAFSQRFVRHLPIDAESDLYGVWLPVLNDHEYVFLCDCRKSERNGGVLSDDQHRRIERIRRKSLYRNLLLPSR